MTVSVSERLSPLYEGNGVNTRFDFTFRVFNQEDASGVSVKHQVGADFENVDEALYNVTINEDNLGGYVTFITAPIVGFDFYIAGETPVDQQLDITNYDNFYPDAIERSLDKLTAILQEWMHSLGFEKISREKALELLNQALQDQILEQGIAMDQIDAYAKDLANRIKNIVIQNGWLAELVVDGDRTQKEINDSQTVKNGEIASLKDYAGNSSGDVSLGLEEALANNSLRITDGEYFIDSSVVVTKDQAINFDFTAKMNFGANGRLTFSGDANLISKPLANIIRGTNTFTIAHFGQIKRGDLLCVFNPTNGSFNPTRDYYKAGEYVEVARVDGDTIIVLGKFYENYNATAVDVYKITPVSIDLSKLNIVVDEANPNPAIKITFGRDCVVSEPKSSGGMYQNIAIDRCYNTTIYGNATSCMADVTANGLQYGIAVYNSQKGRIIGGNYNASRHGIAFGGGSPICSVPCRNWRVIGASVQNWGSTGVGAADMHGNCVDVQYVDSQLDGAYMAGKNNKIKNCRVTGVTTEPSGWGVYTSDTIGGTWDLEDVVIDTTGDGSVRGIVFIQLSRDLTEDLFINIRNLTVKCSPKPIETLVQVIVSGGVIITKKVNIKIDGVRVMGATSLTNLLRFGYSNTGTVAVIPSDYISIDNVEIPTGTRLLFTSNVATTTKLKMPEVNGIQNVNTGDGAQYRIAGTEITLPYIYPRVPTVFTQLSPTGESIWNDEALNAGVTSPPFAGVYSYVHSRKVDKLTVGMYSTGKYLATGRTYAVHWRTSIKDL